MKPDIAGYVEAAKPEYRSGEPISATLFITNQGNQAAYVFVPAGRAGGILIEVKQGRSFKVKDMLQEPEPGLQPELKIVPGETLRQEIPLSDWLELRDPDSYAVECTIPVEVSNMSLRESDPTRVAEKVIIRSDVRFTIL